MSLLSSSCHFQALVMKPETYRLREVVQYSCKNFVKWLQNVNSLKGKLELQAPYKHKSTNSLERQSAYLQSSLLWDSHWEDVSCPGAKIYLLAQRSLTFQNLLQKLMSSYVYVHLPKEKQFECFICAFIMTKSIHALSNMYGIKMVNAQP